MEPTVHAPLVRSNSTLCEEINICASTSDYPFEEVFLQECFFSPKKIPAKLFLVLNRNLNLRGPILRSLYFNLAFKDEF